MEAARETRIWTRETASRRRAAAGGPPLDSAALAAALRRAVRGEVRFDAGSRALYATDGSNYRQVPIGVVVPRDADDVVAAVAVCRRFGAPVLPRGGGTSLAGQCCNVAVALDTSKFMHRLVALDPEQGRARVEPGIVLDQLREAAERHTLTFGPDPATHDHCTLGGMIGNNSCGIHALLAGKTSDTVDELHEGPMGPAGDRPERRYPARQIPRRSPLTLAAVLAGALAAGGALRWTAARRVA